MNSEFPIQGRNFRLLSDDELFDLLLWLTNYLPESLKFHQTLQTFLQDQVWKFHYYVAKSWPQDPVCLHFPGIANENDMFSSFGLFCPIANIECLRLLRDENILIDWNKNLYINYIPTALMEYIENIYSDIGFVKNKCYGDFYVQKDDKKEIFPLNLFKLPDDSAQLQIIQKDDAKLIHDLYPACDIESIEIFEKLIEKLPSYGVYINGKLVAWILQSYYGAMFSMQTKPEFRRLGFGHKLAHISSQIVRARGYIPFVLIRSGNDLSKNLFLSLGFTRLYENVRGLLCPYKNA